MAASGKAGEGESRAPRCPICGKPSVAAFSPFCSKRCARIDLHRWLSGRYAIPAVEEDEAPPERGQEENDEER